MRSGKTAELDPVAQQTEEYIAKAEALSPNNAEIFILKKITSGFRMMVDPMSRYMQESPIAQNALAKAKELSMKSTRAPSSFPSSFAMSISMPESCSVFGLRYVIQ